MSEWRERFGETPALASGLEWVESYYQYLVIAALGVFMVWVRVRTWGRFLVDGEVLFSGNDAWYHYRNVRYTVDHWPQTLPYEVYTNFPEGTLSGQFGTLYDQIIATIALVVGLGNPSEQVVAFVTLFAPVLFAVACLIPAYLLGRRMGGRAGGVAAVIVVAFATGNFLSRSFAGFTDHHIAEALFQALGVLGIAVALAVARREKPIFEQLLDRDFAALRPTVGWSALAGVAVATYLWVWPFGIVLIGILGIYFLLQLSVEFLRGESPDHTAIVGAVSMSVTGVLLVAKIQVVAISPSDFTLLHPLMAFGLAAWCLGMAWLARTWESRDLTTWQYPIAVVGALLALVLLVRIVTPSIFDLFARNVLRIFGLGFGISERAATVGEVTPLRDFSSFVGWFKFAIFTALAAALWILAHVALLRRVRAETVLVVVWAIFMTMATISQARFAYYLAVPVGVLTAYTIGIIVDGLSLQFDADFDDFYRLVGVATIAVFLVVPMVVMTPTAIDYSTQNGPGGDIQAWEQSLDWMQDNTPIEGEFGGADNAMDYDGTYAITDDFDYPAGAYGVLSWWDYGHWITVLSERVPVANPFQQHATEAANFLLAPNETQAAEVLSEVSEDDAATRFVMVDWKMVHTNGQLNPFTARSEVNGKFFAPTQFYDADAVNQSDYFQSLWTTRNLGSLRSISYRTQNYYDAMVVRLYNYHGSAVEPQPVVLDWSVQQQQVGQRSFTVPTLPPESGQSLKVFDNMSAAREYAANDTTSQVGGIGGLPEESIPALEHYRMVGSSEADAGASRNFRLSELLTARAAGLTRLVEPGTCPTSYGITVGTNQGERTMCLTQSGKDVLHPKSTEWTKVFERVPGGTIEGTGPANANVTAAVEMRNQRTNSTFVYRQHAQTNANGEFTMTVPYSTTGYDEWGPSEGHTNVSVRATGPYTFFATTGEGANTTGWNATAHVSEGAVIGESDEPVTVELSEMQSPPAEGATGTEGSDGSGTGGTDGQSGSGTDTAGNDTTGRIAPIAGVRP